MTQSNLKVVILDRPVWYVPSIERAELAKVGAEVVVGWAAQPDPPQEANWGYPEAGMTPEEFSPITSAAVPASLGTEEKLIEMARGADAVILMAAKITARVMDGMPNVRVIGRYGVGVDSIDVPAATERGIPVVYVPGFCAREVADHTMMMVLGLSRKLPLLHGLMAKGVWGRAKASPMPACYRQTLGLIAFGEIGREVALRARAFGFSVLAYDPYVSQAAADPQGVKMVSLDDLLGRSDFVSVHAPLTPQTRHMLSEDQFRRMKPAACVLNTARGPVVDEGALVKALQEGWIAGAGLDVFEKEPADPNNPLFKMENVLLTPHTAGLSDESQRESKHRVARGVAAILTGRLPEGRDLINPQVQGRRPAS